MEKEEVLSLRILKELAELIIKARENNKKIQKTLEKCFGKQEIEGLKGPKERQIFFFTHLARGENINIILKKLEIKPRDSSFRLLLEGLRGIGFSGEFLGMLINEINISDEEKKDLKEKFRL